MDRNPGTTWLQESGLLEGPIGITNTHSVGVVRDAILQWQVTRPGMQPWGLPVVAETFDGVSAAKLVPFQLHGVIELIVSIVLVVLAFALFDGTARVFYLAVGAVIFLVWVLSDYHAHGEVVAR